MFSGNDNNLGGFPGNPSGGGNPFSGGSAGGPPPADAMFESAFEELDDSVMDEIIAASEAREEAKYNFLAVGLHFFDVVKSC